MIMTNMEMTMDTKVNIMTRDKEVNILAMRRNMDMTEI